MVIVSVRCRRTCICQPSKSRPDLYKTGTGTVCLESKAHSTEAFTSLWLLGYSSDRKTGQWPYQKMSSKYSAELAPVSPYCRERNENLDFLFKNIQKPPYFEKAAHYLVPVCWTVRYRNTTEGPAVFYGFTHTFIHGTWQILPSKNSIRCPHLLLWEALVWYKCRKQVLLPAPEPQFPECLWWKLTQSLWIKHKFQLFATGFWSDLTAVQTGFSWSLHKGDHKLYWSV